MRKSSRNSAQKTSAQTSALLLGLAIALLVSQSVIVCQSGALTGFGWALLASLAGCFFATLRHWNRLLQTFLPESRTWKASIGAGCLLAAGLMLFGHSLTHANAHPIMALALSFIPFSRILWRAVFFKQELYSAKDRWASLILLTALVLFVLPEMTALLRSFQRAEQPLQPETLMTLPAIDTPRMYAALAALLLGLASSLQRPQDRTISSQTFWTIPTAIAATVLSISGLIALHISNDRTVLMGQFDAHATDRLIAFSPALVFGVVMLALRPEVQIRNSLRVGRGPSHWWQTLGLFLGIALSLLLAPRLQLSGLDVVTLSLALAGQWLLMRHKQNHIQFAPTLVSVPVSETESPVFSAQQK